MVASVDASQRGVSDLAVDDHRIRGRKHRPGAVLGYAISLSLIVPVKRMDARLQQIASGDFSGAVEVPNRDELGALAANLNRMNEELHDSTSSSRPPTATSPSSCPRCPTSCGRR